jgi:hypothetical protein
MSRPVCGTCWCPFDEDTGECACPPPIVRDDTALLRQALEALEKASGFMRDSDYVKLNQTIAALRARLEETDKT